MGEKKDKKKDKKDKKRKALSASEGEDGSRPRSDGSNKIKLIRGKGGSLSVSTSQSDTASTSQAAGSASKNSKARAEPANTVTDDEAARQRAVAAKAEGEYRPSVEDGSTFVNASQSMAQTTPRDDAQAGFIAEATVEDQGATKLNAVAVPAYASWFDLGKIHAIESRALPEFFNNRSRSKTATVYKEYRAFMIETYRMRPAQ